MSAPQLIRRGGLLLLRWPMETLPFGCAPFEFAVQLERRPRGAGGHYWAASWFPCWRLTCAWGCLVLGKDPLRAEEVKLRAIFAEVAKWENRQYLPEQAARFFARYAQTP